jgi:hypothetical protein
MYDPTYAQALFDESYTKLAAQGCAAVNGLGHCKYRTDQGHACAVGVLLTDEEYDPQMDEENMTVTLMSDRGLLPARLEPYIDLLVALQSKHDYYLYALDGISYPTGIQPWKNELRTVAANHGLSAAILS